jgi:hypothetical protein
MMYLRPSKWTDIRWYLSDVHSLLAEGYNIPWTPIKAFLSLACLSCIPLLFFKACFLSSSTINVTFLQLTNIWTKSVTVTSIYNQQMYFRDG